MDGRDDAADGKVEAMLGLRRGGLPLVGRDRITVLEAVAAHGSITKAAKAVGLSYKAAWDALNAINNLLPRPAVQSQIGGRHGGGAVVTEDGYALIATFRQLEERLNRITGLLTEEGLASAEALTSLWSFGMKTSARNLFRGTVTEIRPGGVNAEVILRLTDSIALAAVITMESLADLGIVVGRPVTALVKSSFIMLAQGGEPLAVSARNRIVGTVAHREDGPINSEVIIDIGEGKTIAAVVTRDAADEMGLRIGDLATALFKASHVILAVE